MYCFLKLLEYWGNHSAEEGRNLHGKVCQSARYLSCCRCSVQFSAEKKSLNILECKESTKADKIFSDYNLCQFAKISNVSGTIPMERDGP